MLWTPHHGPPTYSPQAFIGKCMLFKYITASYIIDNRLSSLSLTNWVTQNSWTDFRLVFTHTSPMAGQNRHVVCHPSLRQLCTLDLKAVIHLFLIRRLSIQTPLSHVLNFLWYSIQNCLYISSKIIMLKSNSTSEHLQSELDQTTNFLRRSQMEIYIA